MSDEEVTLEALLELKEQIFLLQMLKKNFRNRAKDWYASK